MLRLGREFSDGFGKCPSSPGGPSMRGPSPVRSPHFPLDARCTAVREELPCLPRTCRSRSVGRARGGGTGKGLGCPAPPSPVRRTARGEVRPPSWLSARSLLESAANNPLVNLQLWCRELPKFDKGHAHCCNGQCLRSAAPMMNCLTHMHRTGWPHEFSVGAQCRCGKRRG